MNMSEMRERAGEAGRFLKSLCNEHRLLILCSLVEGEKSVGEMERLLDMRQPHLSQHLTRLRADGLVETRRVSRTIFYRLGSEPAERMIGLLHELFCARGAAAASPTEVAPRPPDGGLPMNSEPAPAAQGGKPARGPRHG